MYSRRSLLKHAGMGIAATALMPVTVSLGAEMREKPNFLVILVDDLGFNDLGCYGARDPAIKTPHIDRMAEEGIRLTDWFSGCSVCAPSRAALLTGRYPQRCGLPICPTPTAFGEHYNQNTGLQDSEITIAKLLKPLGYRTAMYGKSHLGHDPKFYPLRHGFDEYYGSLSNFPIGGTSPVLEGDDVVDPAMKYQDIHKKLTRRTIDFMAKSRKAGKPFFIYLAHYLVHGPWDPNREFATDEEWAIYQKQPVKGHLRNGGDKLYPALVRELDWHVGEVLKALKEQGLEKNTFVLFMADNGPWLPAGSAWPLRGSKFNTFEGGHRVPSIARWPGRIPAKQVSDKLCSTMDVLPTIGGLAGAGLPEDRVIDGADIWDVMTGKAKGSPHDVLYYYNGLTLEVVRKGKWKLHLPRKPHMQVHWARGRLGGLHSLDEPLLYNLAEDVSEKEDVAAKHPDVVKELLALAAKARAELGDWNCDGTDRKKLLNYTGDPNRPPVVNRKRRKR